MTRRSASDATRADAKARVAAVWERYSQVIADQVELVGRAADLLARGDLDDDLRMRAVRDAHKLAGSLGTFGLRRGSRLARELEDAFRAEATPGQDDITRTVATAESLRREVEQGPPFLAAAP